MYYSALGVRPRLKTIGLCDEVPAGTELAGQGTRPQLMTLLTRSSRGRSRGINFPDCSWIRWRGATGEILHGVQYDALPWMPLESPRRFRR
jgi:hypothetical protein